MPDVRIKAGVGGSTPSLATILLMTRRTLLGAVVCNW